MKNKLLLIAAFVAFAAISAKAQVASLLSPTQATFETVVNTGTVFLTTGKLQDLAVQQVTVQVNVTKVSGTVGGTISLLGSLDGTNFKAINLADGQTALATITAADATASYHWRLTGSPFLYYRVSYTGAATMNATFTAQIYRNKSN